MVYKICQYNKRTKSPCAGEVDGEPISESLFIHSAYSRWGGGYVVSDIDTGAAVATEATRIEVIARAMELVNTGRYARAKKAFIAEYGLVSDLPLAPVAEHDPTAHKITPELAAIFARTREARAELKTLLDNPPASDGD